MLLTIGMTAVFLIGAFALALRAVMPRTLAQAKAPMVDYIGRCVSVMPAPPHVECGPDDANAGIETLRVALIVAGTAVDGASVADTDGDEGSDLRGREYVDTFGNPLVYFDAASYEAFSDGGALVALRGGTRIRVMPLRTKDGWFRGDSFQLFSIGPDLEPGTDDDIHFER